MKTWTKWAGATAGALVVLAVAAALAGLHLADRKMARKIDRELQ